MTELFLADTSALVRYFRRQSDPNWDHVVAAGRIGICEPVRQEYLRAAGARSAYYEADSLLQETFPYYVVRDDVWDGTAALQHRLAEKSWHQSASPVDLLVAATAAHHELTVLHADTDFETIARLTGQPVRRID
ncbi:PIN domain nuclease [Nocardia speluncae]|uniref:Ribonuclease VapC n=1 Tax=Nocardia speluncae TaxID=419477 RepID=A0A846XMH8_9NOCA|nr:PIN domain nuclease [Nocardia speluncae]NKY37541.1 PIN domain nuclease [Nocardia speluncae]